MSDDADMVRRFKPPIYAETKHGDRRWCLNLGDEEQALIARMLSELRALLTSADDDPDAPVAPMLQRLFPPAFLDDEEKEAEYQRLMREELVTSRVVQIDAVTEMLGPDAPKHLDEGNVIGLMQSINAVRVVLGTLLDIGEDDEIDPGDEATPEHQLYGFLSWLLDWTVKSLG
jgi:Domain of unknown function (DUF2017)